MTINEKIYDVAKSYIGQQEIPGNNGFKNQVFADKIKNMGWLKGQPWCSYFAELVWKEAYQQINPELYSELGGLFSGSVMLTYNNFKKNSKFIKSDKPIQGALVVFQNVKTPAQGHIGVVSSVLDSINFRSIEGNTNDGAGREGYIVAENKRKIGTNGTLKLLGFILPS